MNVDEPADEPHKTPLYNANPVIEGKRVRKAVEAFKPEVAAPAPVVTTKEVWCPSLLPFMQALAAIGVTRAPCAQGKGQKLGDIPNGECVVAWTGCICCACPGLDSQLLLCPCSEVQAGQAEGRGRRGGLAAPLAV